MFDMIVSGLLAVNLSPNEMVAAAMFNEMNLQYSDTCLARYVVLMGNHTEYDEATLVFDVLLPEAMKYRISRSYSG